MEFQGRYRGFQGVSGELRMIPGEFLGVAGAFVEISRRSGVFKGV